MPSTAAPAPDLRPLGRPAASAADAWDRWAPSYDDTAGLFSRVAEDTILEALAPSGMRVLDVGCGTGALSRRIARVAREVVGIDPSAAMIDRARRSAPGNARFEVRSLHDLPPGERFDAVLASHLLHHMDIAGALVPLQRCLAPGGLLLIVDPVRGTGGDLFRYLLANARRFGPGFTLRLIRSRLVSRAWRRHSREESLPAFSAFEARYAAHLPGAVIRRIHVLFGMVEWRKDAGP